MAPTDLSDLKSVYLIHGAEDLLLEQAIGRLKHRFEQDGDLEYNFQVFEGESTSADDVIAAANTLPFMADKRLVVLRHADKMNATDLGALAQYAADPNPTTALVLVAQKMAKNLKIYKAIDALGGVAEYKAPAKRDYPRTVVDMFASRGKSIGMDGAEVLVRGVGYDLRRISIEMDKILAFTGEREKLSRADVEEVMSATAPASVFDLLDALGSRDCRAALVQLNALLGGGESIYGVHSMALRHIRQLLQARALLDRVDGSRSPEALAKAIGMSPWQAKNIMRQAKRFTAEELVNALRNAAAGEAQMKTSRDPRLVFERWLIAVCG
ncbi:MAG: DNA polymerase III subunit delta [Coriobacteriia bacterium]|nr:DNA polymerase III subunit delta [Coriobacteriia bacterium]